MVSVLGLINRLLPFATPGTPLIQDIIHLTAICLVLYFAPAVQEWNARRAQQTRDIPAPNVNRSEVAEPIEPIADSQATPIEIEGFANRTTSDGLESAIEQRPTEPVLAELDSDNDGDNQDASEDEHQPQSSTQRNIGAKKAKSLARKDQRKAYHEFMRSQGEVQRARDAEGAAEREAALEAERKRRALAEAELNAKKAREREQKREAEKAEREAEYRRREAAISLVKAELAKSNLSDLHRIAAQVGGDVDEEWVEKVINASGMIGRKENVLTMITSTGWAARISNAQAHALYSRATSQDVDDSAGYVDTPQLSKTFVAILNQTIPVTAA